LPCGERHAEDAAMNEIVPGARDISASLQIDDAPEPPLSYWGAEDWVAFAFFWGLAVVVFLQFFTRYVLNDSLAWTEEIARYLLICTAFVGAGMASRRNTHIRVEFFYLWLGGRAGFLLSTLCDLLTIVFFAYATWLGWKVTVIMDTQRMVIIDWPMSWVFGPACLGLALVTVRSVQTAWRNWQSGSSVLTRVAEEGRHT
jgi:TRAP-type transport system small permease protein